SSARKVGVSGSATTTAGPVSGPAVWSLLSVALAELIVHRREASQGASPPVRTVDRPPGRAGLALVSKHDETVREREGRLLSERRDHVLVVREDHNLLPRRGPAVDAVQAGDRIETTQGLLEQHAHAFSPTTRAVFPKYPASSHIPSYAKPIPGWSRLP